MANLGSLMVQVGADTSSLRRAEQEVKQSASSMSSSLLSVGNVLKGLAFAYAANQARLFASQVIDTGMKLQQLTLSFKAISGSTVGAAEEMGFIRRESNRLGQDMMSLADAYKGIAAAAKGTTLEGKGVQDVFSAVSEAATVLGLTSEQTGRSLYALSQMISKGKVSSEELRQQLGENLPGAFQIAAQSMNMTTQEFDKMLSEGKILTEDFLPKFAKLLHERYSGSVADSATSARAASNRLSNALTELQNVVWKQGEPAYSAFLQWLTSVVQGSADAVKAIGSAEEATSKFGATVETVAKDGETWLEKFSRSMVTQSSQWAKAFDDATAKAASLAAEILNIPEVKSITIRWFNEVFGSAPDVAGTNTEAERIALVNKETHWRSQILSQKVFGSETARSQSGKGAAALASEVYGDALKRNQKYRDKYTSDLEKHQKLLADIKNAGYMAGDSAEDIAYRVNAAEQEFAKAQSRGGGGGKGGRSSEDEAWKYRNSIMEEGRRIVEGNFTATEKYNLELDKLNWYLGAGALTQEEYDRAVQATWKDLEKANEMSDGWQGHLKILADGKNVYQSVQTAAEQYEQELARLDYLLSYGAITTETYQRAVKELKEEFGKSTNSMSEFAVQAARNIQDALGDQLYNVLTGNFEDIGKSFGQMIAKMVAQAAAAQLGNWLFGDFGTTKQIGGVVGSIGDWLFGGGGTSATTASTAINTAWSFFDAMLADGGQTSPGKAYIVGEKGPELFYPGISGTVVPNSSISASASPPNIDIVVNNETGQKIDADRKEVSFDGASYHASISLRLLKNNTGGYRDAMKSMLRG